MKECRTFIKLLEAVGSKQAKARNQGYAGAPGAAASNVPHSNQPPANGTPQTQGQPNQGNQNDGGYIPSKGHIAAMIQPVPNPIRNRKAYLDKST
jgi:hypothetical protein